MKTADELLASGTVTIKAVTDVPGWGEIFIKSLSIETLNELRRSDVTADAVAQVIASVCDENGNLIFTETNRPQLNKTDFRTIEAVLKATNELNGFSTTIEERVKN